MKFQLCASTQNSRIWVQVCRSVRLPVRETTVAISPRMSSPPSRDHSHARLCRGTGTGLLEEARPASGDPAACGGGVDDVWVGVPSGIRGPPLEAFGVWRSAFGS